jgi:hypothetical protein
MVALPLLVGYRNILAVIATALVLPPAVFLIFWYGLKVALPGASAIELLKWIH